MTRWLSMLLLISSVLGLIGQEAAFANVVPLEAGAKSVSVPQKTVDCAEMMGLAVPKPPLQPEKPCQGMTPDCIAKMGCATRVPNRRATFAAAGSHGVSLVSGDQAHHHLLVLSQAAASDRDAARPELCYAACAVGALRLRLAS